MKKLIQTVALATLAGYSALSQAEHGGDVLREVARDIGKAHIDVHLGHPHGMDKEGLKHAEEMARERRKHQEEMAREHRKHHEEIERERHKH